MLSLTGMLNNATIASIYFIFLNELVKKRRIGKLEHMTNNGGYLLALDLFNFVNCQQRCSARFNSHVWKLCVQMLFTGVCDKNKMLNGERAFILNS